MLSETQFRKLDLICTIRKMKPTDYLWEVLGKHLDNINIEDVISDIEDIFGQEKPTIVYNTIPQEEVIIPKSSRKLYTEMVLKRDVFYSKKSGKKFVFDIYEMILIKSYIKGLTVAQFRELRTMLKTSNNQLYRTIYNLQNNSHLNEMIDGFMNNIQKCKFSVKDDTIYINGDSTNISKEEVKEMFYRLDNADDKQLCMLRIQQSNVEDPLHIRLICEHRNNPHLKQLIKTDKTVKAVNNREKRANLILNGGI